MPHLIIQYSAKLGTRYEMDALCEALRLTMVNAGCFPLGGIRVRAFAADAQAVADSHPDNTFVDMLLRMGAGRSAVVRQDAGAALLKTAEDFFENELRDGHFALSLEITEIDPEFSWKTNTIHARLKGST